MKFTVLRAAYLYFENGWSTNDIAHQFGVGQGTVRRALQQAGCKLRTNSESQTLRNADRDLRIDEILDLYFSEKLSAREIERRTGIDDCVILKRIRQAGFEPRRAGFQPRNRHGGRPNARETRSKTANRRASGK